MNATDIAAYTYQAENLCPTCTVDAVVGGFDPTTTPMNVEAVLDEIAAGLPGLDRHDESSYDSSDFPKVVFAYQVEENETCGECGEQII